jgi:hypothetical protein
MTHKLIFISNNVRDDDFFIKKSLPDVTYVQLNYKESIDEVKQKLSSLDLTNITNIGLIFDNTCDQAPFITYTVSELEQEKDLQLKCQEKIADYCNTNNGISKLQTSDILIEDEYQINPIFFTSGQFFSTEFYNLLIELKNTSNLNVIDIISCNIRNNIQFSDLQEKGIIIRYSTNITGQGGDWILESHNVNVTPIYFTDDVKDYPYRLGAVTPTAQENGNWIIDSADKLYWLMTRTSNTGPVGVPNLSSSFIITENIDMENVTGGGSALYPTRSIGNKTNTSLSPVCRFTGKLFGNNKQVIIRNIDNNFFSGFIGNFGSISNPPLFPPAPANTPIPATVDNLTIKYSSNISFIVPPRILPANQFEVNILPNIFSGLLIGIARAGTINNCKVSFADDDLKIISITNIQPIGTFATGGFACELGLLIGRNQGATNITNCTVKHTNDIRINCNPIYGSNIGGFCGLCLTTDINALVTISNNKLNVQKTLEIIVYNDNIVLDNEFNNIGGFIGQTSSINNSNPRTIILNNIFECRDCRINGFSNLNRANLNIIYAIGGFLGRGQSKFDIDNCSIITHNNLELLIEDNSGIRTVGSARHLFFMGGFTGILTTNPNIFFNINNSKCITKRLSISSQLTDTTNIAYENYIGLLIGYISNSVNLNNNTLVSSEILGIGSSAPLGTGDSFFGLGIGFSEGIINNLTITLNKIYLLTVMTNSRIFFGCLIGLLQNSTITNSTITGNELSSDGIITIDGETRIFDILTSGIINYGGLFGVITDTSISNTNIANITNLSLTAKSSNIVRMGGIAGYILNGGSLIGSTANIGANSNLISLQNNSSAFIGGLIGLTESTTGLIQNNTITYGNYLTFKANETATTIGVNSLVGTGILNGTNNNVVFVSYPLIFNSISNGTGINFEGIDYLIQPQTITITTNPFFLIDLSDITVYVHLRPIDIPSTIPPCCVANVCDANPQTANYDNQNVVHSASGAALVGAVSNFYAAAAAGQIRPNAPPIFKTYGQMMDWKQRQNRR